MSRAAGPHRVALLSLTRLAETLDVDEPEVERLAAMYVAEGIILAEYEVGALHAAYAAVSGIEVLVTLNLRHLANEWTSRRLNAVNLREGYPLVSIRTPEEVVRHED